MSRMKKLRKEKGLTQEELGKLLNVQDSAVAKYENGKIAITASTLVKLSEIFNVSVDYLLGLSNCRKLDTTIPAMPTDWSKQEVEKIIDVFQLDSEDKEMAVGIIEMLLKKDKYKLKKDMTG